MTSLKRSVFFACVLVLVALGLQVHPASSQEQSGATSGQAVQVAMVPVPLANAAPSFAEPVLLCGKVWVDTDYVLPNNCLKACLNKGHSLQECKTKLVPLCLSCWRQLQVCANNRTIPPRERCRVCTDRYAACMKPFF